VVVEALHDKRGPASLARTLYAETPASVEKREIRAEQNRLSPHSAPQGRPDKRERRKIRSFKGKRL